MLIISLVHKTARQLITLKCRRNARTAREQHRLIIYFVISFSQLCGLPVVYQKFNRPAEMKHNQNTVIFTPGRSRQGFGGVSFSSSYGEGPNGANR